MQESVKKKNRTGPIEDRTLITGIRIRPGHG
jgi:hypothetical protein